MQLNIYIYTEEAHLSYVVLSVKLIVSNYEGMPFCGEGLLW